MPDELARKQRLLGLPKKQMIMGKQQLRKTAL
jgi:hypothetical protein